jgi:fatty acid amide hydrolase 2
VVQRFEDALKDAGSAEKRYRSGEAGLLEGIPCTVKETISVKGYPSTYGSVFRRNNRALKDAPVVANIKKEGAIVLGFTNTPECCFWMETFNKIYGRTNNPYDLARTPGGSSGGEGAIIAAGGVPFGVGSDVAGSIRMPSAFCGIFGLAPSAGMVSVEGHYPYDYTSVREFPDLKLKAHLKIGPMVRKAEDLWPLYNAFAGRGRPSFQDNLQRKDWKKVKVLVLEDPSIKLTSGATDEVVQGVLRAAEIFKSAGAEVIHIEPKIFNNIFEIWQTFLREATGFSLTELFGNGKKLSLGMQALKMLVGKSDITLPGLTSCIAENVLKPSPEKIKKLMAEGYALKARLSEMLGENGILLMPVHPVVAPKHNHPYLTPFNWNYTTIFNALGNPAASVPVGINKKGLPLAVQIAAGTGNDRLCCEAAILLESVIKPQTLKMEVGC